MREVRRELHTLMKNLGITVTNANAKHHISPDIKALCMQLVNAMTQYSINDQPAMEYNMALQLYDILFNYAE